MKLLTFNQRNQLYKHKDYHRVSMLAYDNHLFTNDKVGNIYRLAQNFIVAHNIQSTYRVIENRPNIPGKLWTEYYLRTGEDINEAMKYGMIREQESLLKQNTGRSFNELREIAKELFLLDKHHNKEVNLPLDFYINVVIHNVIDKGYWYMVRVMNLLRKLEINNPDLKYEIVPYASHNIIIKVIDTKGFAVAGYAVEPLQSYNHEDKGLSEYRVKASGYWHNTYSTKSKYIIAFTDINVNNYKFVEIKV